MANYESAGTSDYKNGCLFIITQYFFSKNGLLKTLQKRTLVIALLGVIGLGQPDPARPLHAKYSHKNADKDKTWSEKKLHKTIMSIDKDVRKKRWKRIIKRSQEALSHCIELHGERDQRCINLLRNINTGYEKTRRFNDNAEQIKLAYTLALEELGTDHFSTIISRDYYYKYLLFHEKYIAAIPIVKEIIAAEKNRGNDRFEILERTTQLYALYGLTDQFELEEKTLLSLLQMTEELIGKDGEEYKTVAEALAENYCTQKKYHEFFDIVRREKLESRCTLVGS